jgi:hypothetical protein
VLNVITSKKTEEEVEADVPVKELEVSWVLEEELADEGARVLDERVDSHDVEE